MDLHRCFLTTRELRRCDVTGLSWFLINLIAIADLGAQNYQMRTLAQVVTGHGICFLVGSRWPWRKGRGIRRRSRLRWSWLLKASWSQDREPTVWQLVVCRKSQRGLEKHLSSLRNSRHGIHSGGLESLAWFLRQNDFIPAADNQWNDSWKMSPSFLCVFVQLHKCKYVIHTVICISYIRYMNDECITQGAFDYSWMCIISCVRCPSCTCRF